MRLETDGLVIKEKQIGEADRLATVLTRARGLVSAFVSGARRLQNKNAVSTSLLCYSDFTFYKKKDTYRVNEAATKKVFFALRSDVERLALAQYFCELCLCLAEGESGAEDFLRLMLGALYLLDEKKRSPLLIKAAVEMRICALSGYMPDLVGCSACGEAADGGALFDLQNGRLICPRCRQEAGPVRTKAELSPGLLAALRHIVYSQPEKLFSFQLSEESLRALSGITERYTAIHTDQKEFKALAFYKSL